jgi:hypothetical protein
MSSIRYAKAALIALISALISQVLLLDAAFADPDSSHEGGDALFRQHCKTAGEHIVRTVDNVKGIALLKIRTSRNFDRQFDFDDPYGADVIGKGYIKTFLRGYYQSAEMSRRGREAPITIPSDRVGYEFIEASDPNDGKRYRYSGHIEQPGLTNTNYLKEYWRFVLDTVPAPERRARYGVTFDDISTHEDRVHWIAGSSLKIIDLNTNEVIAERIGYMIDPGRGYKYTNRSPWLEAATLSCPQFGGKPAHTDQPGQTSRFVQKVLRPAQ